MKIKYLTGKKVYYGVLSGAKKVISSRQLLNKINVFPVPDGDTGSNLASMMQAIVQDAQPENTIKQTLNSIAEAALWGARGNSGLIFAQFLTGLAEELEESSQLTVANFSRSVQRAVPYVYQAVAEPVEGTMITVINDWAQSLEELQTNTGDFLELFTKSLIDAKQSLQATKEKLAVLEEAEVVDAGAKGFVKFLEGIVDLIQGRGLEKIKAVNQSKSLISGSVHHTEDEFRYCTEVFITDLELALEEIKSRLNQYGNSLAAAGTKQQARLHLHTNRPAEVVYDLSQWGTVTRQKVDDMKRQAAAVHNRQSDIALITDSIADLPQELIDSYQIQVIPLNLSVAGDNYLDKLTITSDKFYSLLEESSQPASSSQPTMKQVENLFSFLSSHYQSIITVTVASQLSGTWSLVKQVADRYQEQEVDITVIDSRLNSGAQGLVVLEAAEKIAAGGSQQEVIAQIERAVDKAEIYVSVDTVKYMIKGGRIGKLKGGLARLLNLKPIISLDDQGAGTAFDKAFSQRGLRKKIKQIVKEINDKTGIKRYCIVHAQAEKKAQRYQEEFTELVGQAPEYVMEISPVVGLNAGPGSVAVALIKE